ncbi:MAG: MoaD/ThiS family protein [Bacillota bacterium]
MEIQVKLFATFRQGRFTAEKMEFPEGSTILNVVEKLAIDPAEVAIAMINGKSAELDAVLSEGDTLGLFPPVGGG